MQIDNGGIGSVGVMSPTVWCGMSGWTCEGGSVRLCFGCLALPLACGTDTSADTDRERERERERESE